MLSFSVWPPGLGSETPNGAAQPTALPWSEFAAWLASPLESEDKHAQAFSPLSAILPGKGGRINGGPAGFLALEYDYEATPALLRAAFERLAGFDAVIYTTASATEQVPRFRVVLRPSRPIVTDAEYRSCVDYVGLLLGARPAPESRQRTRIWYRPIRGCSTRVCSGAAWDVDASLQACPPPPPRVRAPVDVSAFAADARWQQAWQALDRRRPSGSFAAALICRDYALPEELAAVAVIAYADAQGWDADAGELETRVEHAYEYARSEPGQALVPTTVEMPNLLAAITTAPEGEPPVAAGTHVLNDGGNADRLIDLFGKDLRFCDGLGWLKWDGRRWAASDGPWAEVEACAKLVRDEGARVGGDLGSALVAWGKKSGNAKEIANAIRVAEHRVELRVEATDLDADPWLFNCGNGTIDLRTGTVREHRRADLITKISSVEYDGSATAPRFVTFLRECMAGDEEVVGYVLRFLGYCLTGSVREHVFGLWHGPSGRNGKSVLLNILLHVLGEYGGTLPPSVLLASKHEQHPTALMSLRGLRFVASNEVPEGQRFNESLVKQLTGGDRIKARAMRQDFVEFEPTHKLVLACNARPLVREHGPAFWSRVAQVPWEVSFRGREDRHLEETLRREAPGILRVLVAASASWSAGGLAPPAKITDAGADYRESQDVVGAFLEETCESGPGFSTSRSVLFSAYKYWAEDAGEFLHGKHAFNRIIQERGFALVKPRGGGEIWQGIRVRPSGLAAVRPT